MVLMPVNKALEKILSHISALPAEEIPITHGYNRVLAEDVRAIDNIPPFRNSAMDGYAVHAADVAAATPESPVVLPVSGYIAAGDVPANPLPAGNAIRIMTGAPVPDGANAVVRFEKTSDFIDYPNLPAGHVTIFHPVATSDNVREPGEDVAAGTVVLQKGHALRPQDVGMLAAVGKGRVRVHKIPRVGILATGDELVGVDEPLAPGKIRNSNEYTLAALVESYGAVAVPLGVARDSTTDLVKKIDAGLAQGIDMLLSSAGVSAGDYDVVKNVLAQNGEMHFWQVDIKPGKPLAYGTVRGVPLIGLPGNPVASVVAFEVFARAAILKLGGHVELEKPILTATLVEDVHNSGRQHYMRAHLFQSKNKYRVTTRGSGVLVQGSGILSSLVNANALVVVPSGVKFIPAGTAVDVWMLDWRGGQIPTNSQEKN